VGVSGVRKRCNIKFVYCHKCGKVHRWRYRREGLEYKLTKRLDFCPAQDYKEWR